MRLERFDVFFGNKFIVLGFVVHLLISPFFAHNFDVGVFVSAAKLFYYRGIIEFFVKWPYPFYSYLVIVGSYFPAYLFTDDVFFFGQPFSLLEKFFIKLPMNICDLFIAYILFLIMRKLGKERYAIPVALFYLFNPMSVLISSFWGMIDSVSTLFALLSVYHFSERRWMLSGFELGVGFGLKIHPIILLPLFIFLLWREGKEYIFKFVLAFSVPAAFSILPSLIVQCISINPIIHFYSLGFYPSALSSIFHTSDYFKIFDPNMTFRTLLYMCYSPFFFFGTFEGNEFFYFGILYLVFFLFLRKTRFFDREFPLGITRLTVCVSVVYLLYFLSYPRVNQQYFLWVLPFLLVMFAVGKLDKIILLTINFIPFAHTFSRGGFFYYVNQNYYSYGASFVLPVAVGFLFSLSCVFVIQSLLKEEFLTYKPFEKVYQFFEGIPLKKRKLLFILSLVSMFTIIVIVISGNGVYLGGYPINFSVSLPYFPTTLEKKIALLLFVSLMLLPLTLVIAPTLKTTSGKRKFWKWELGIFIIALSMLAIISSIILWSTIPYINTGTSFFFGWVPIFGDLRFLCENGGIITTILMLIIGFTGLDLLLKLPENENKLTTLNSNKQKHKQ
ncbi:MAG: hypothetical protein QW279_08215 [Candidatus Jordarchaeaceae archaeon]